MMTPYRQPAPPSDYPSCIVCDQLHDYHISLKHPSGTGWYRVCRACVDAFKDQHDKDCKVPFCPEWTYAVHSELALCYNKFWQVGISCGPLKLCWARNPEARYEVRYPRLKKFICNLIGHKSGWFRCGRCGLKDYWNTK